MKIKKKGLLIVAFFITGFIGLLNGFMRTNSSNPSSNTAAQSALSPLAQIARADVPSCGASCDLNYYTQADCNCYFCGVQCGAGDGGDCSSSGGSCFPKGTIISGPTGNKTIETFVVGDEVYAFDPETGNVKISVVEKTFKHSWADTSVRSPLIVVTHTKGKLMLTTNHPVYKRESGEGGEYRHFVEAGRLKIGDLLTLENGEESEIMGIDNGSEYDFVYNLEIAKYHTYIADGVRVHNKST